MTEEQNPCFLAGLPPGAPLPDRMTFVTARQLYALQAGETVEEARKRHLAEKFGESSEKTSIIGADMSDAQPPALVRTMSTRELFDRLSGCQFTASRWAV